MSNEVLLQATVQGLQMGAIYALIALSMTLIFGVGGLLNFAHGDFMALAMYGAMVAYVSFKIDAYVIAPIMFALFFVLGILLFRRLVQPVLAAGVLAGAQLTLGLVFVQENLILVVFGGDYINVPANAEHWFEMRGCTRCKAVRYFIDTTGWTPNYTGRARKFAEAAATA